MTNREKVKKGLFQHCEGSMFDRCGECPYYEVADEPFQCRDPVPENADRIQAGIEKRGGYVDPKWLLDVLTGHNENGGAKNDAV